MINIPINIPTLCDKEVEIIILPKEKPYKQETHSSDGGVNISEEAQLQPMTINEFNKMIDCAEKDNETGRLISSEEIKNEIEAWT